MGPLDALLVTDPEREMTAIILRETSKLTAFIKRRVRDVGDAEDILQDVFHEFVQAYRLPESIEQVSRWLFRVARNRIIDRFRKRKEQPVGELPSVSGDEATEDGLEIWLPARDCGPEALLARSILLEALQHALDELPTDQRNVYIAHEIEGLSFKEISLSSGTSVNTLLGRKRYAVLALRARLQSVYDELDL
jgi:RNA polymerase sigma factor (sigma-70 family)